jgi:predicted site-specific integrase-resolvase
MKKRSPRYLKVSEFCEVVDRSPYTAQRWRSEGGGPPYLKVGGRVMYDEERVHEWLASHEQTSTSNEGRPASSRI